MRHFTSKDLAVETKRDGTPVTRADREVEERLRELVAEQEPHAGFLGEEVGETEGGGRRRWIVDGVDGTTSFVAGGAGWGTGIALEVDGEFTVGVMSSPAIPQRAWAGRGLGSWLQSGGDGQEQAVRLKVSETDSLARARASFFMVPNADRWRGAVADRLAAELLEVVPHEHAITVASGELDIAVNLNGALWDFAPGAVIVEEAGGCFADASGRRRANTGTAVFTNGRLLDQVVGLIREAEGLAEVP